MQSVKREKLERVFEERIDFLGEVQGLLDAKFREEIASLEAAEGRLRIGEIQAQILGCLQQLAGLLPLTGEGVVHVRVGGASVPFRLDLAALERSPLIRVTDPELEVFRDAVAQHACFLYAREELLAGRPLPQEVHVQLPAFRSLPARVYVAKAATSGEGGTDGR